MSPYLRAITARQLVSALGRDGWIWDHSDGSHRFYRKGPRVVPVPYHHPGATFPPKTLARIIAGTGWTDDDLRRLRLLK